MEFDSGLMFLKKRILFWVLWFVVCFKMDFDSKENIFVLGFGVCFYKK